VYSNPEVLFTLPFPYLLSPPPERFKASSSMSKHMFNFSFMGRENYVKIRDSITTLLNSRFLNSSSSGEGVVTKEVYFYGNLGGGKSHILITLALDFFATFRLKKQPYYVVIIPDCAAMLAEGPLTYLTKCFALAFADSEDNLKTVEKIQTLEHLLELTNSAAQYINLLFVVDQDNALDIKDADPTVVQTQKFECRRLLSSLASSHFMIRGASANNESALRRYQKQQNIFPIDIFGGFTEVQTSFF
jgi:hypothetical protein